MRRDADVYHERAARGESQQVHAAGPRAALAQYKRRSGALFPTRTDHELAAANAPRVHRIEPKTKLAGRFTMSSGDADRPTLKASDEQVGVPAATLCGRSLRRPPKAPCPIAGSRENRVEPEALT